MWAFRASALLILMVALAVSVGAAAGIFLLLRAGFRVLEARWRLRRLRPSGSLPSFSGAGSSEESSKPSTREENLENRIRRRSG